MARQNPELRRGIDQFIRWFVQLRTFNKIAVLIGAAVLLFVYFERANREPEASSRPAPELPKGEAGTASADPELHLALGNPSQAKADPANRNNYLMKKPYYALSYNDQQGGPNWVSWCLRAGDLGSAPRTDFRSDDSLPAGFTRVTKGDYSGSGFDRGHMCPRSDRGWSKEAANATFLMTNIIPQSPACNQKAWNDLEVSCRDLAKQGQTLYIVCGPSGVGGEGTAGKKDSLANGKVSVPEKCWKVVLVLPNGTGTAVDADRVGNDTRLIAVVMPNNQTVGNGWGRYRTTVREVEKLTGYTFFDRVPAAVIDPLKERIDRGSATTSRTGRGED